MQSDITDLLSICRHVNMPCTARSPNARPGGSYADLSSNQWRLYIGNENLRSVSAYVPISRQASSSAATWACCHRAISARMPICRQVVLSPR